MLAVFVIMAFLGAAVIVVRMLVGADADIDLDIDDIGGGGVSRWLSLNGASAFVTAFGAAGAIARVTLPDDWQLSGFMAFAIATAAGLGGMFLAGFFFQWLKSQQVTSNFSSDQLQGAEGQVTTEILPGKIGEIRVMFQGRNIAKPARCADESISLKYGTPIKITSIVGSMATVEPLA